MIKILFTCLILLSGIQLSHGTTADENLREVPGLTNLSNLKEEFKEFQDKQGETRKMVADALIFENFAYKCMLTQQDFQRVKTVYFVELDAQSLFGSSREGKVFALYGSLNLPHIREHLMQVLVGTTQNFATFVIDYKNTFFKLLTYPEFLDDQVRKSIAAYASFKTFYEVCAFTGKPEMLEVFIKNFATTDPFKICHLNLFYFGVNPEVLPYGKDRRYETGILITLNQRYPYLIDDTRVDTKKVFREVALAHAGYKTEADFEVFQKTQNKTITEELALVDLAYFVKLKFGLDIQTYPGYENLITQQPLYTYNPFKIETRLATILRNENSVDAILAHFLGQVSTPAQTEVMCSSVPAAYSQVSEPLEYKEEH